MAKSATTSADRVIKQPTYKSFRLSKRISSNLPKLMPSRRLLVQSVGVLWQHKGLFGGILGVFAFLQLLLVQGVLAADFASIAALVRESVQEQITGLGGGLALFAYLIGSSTQGVSSEGSVYQTILLIIVSLAVIWALRHVTAGLVVRVRDSYYKGMTPFVPFVLVLLVVLIQLVPMLFGAWLYQAIVASGVAVTTIEQLFWLTIGGLFALLTFYMLSSSLMALYVVTLPDMTPMKALRSARSLVLHRRRSIFWRIAVLAFACALVLLVSVVPVIMIAPALAPWVFYLMTVVLLGLVHSYMYGLYRELLKDA